MPSIFVGSASESESLARKLCIALDENGFQAVPWWDAFDLGDVTIQALKKQTFKCDGAVFLFTADDEVTSRGKDTSITRDNVILEYGLFASQLGTEKTIAFLEEGVKNPTDFVGLTQEVFNSNHPDFERLIKHFKKTFQNKKKSSTNKRVPLIFDNNLSKTLLDNDNFPKEWKQRLLYFGLEGAKNWTSVCQDSNYAAMTIAKKTKEALEEAVSNIEEIQDFISLGPGDARLDTELVVSLSNRRNIQNYIPADINIHFSNQAALMMQSSINVPFSLVVDFEENLEFLIHEVNKFSQNPKLYSLLGYTLSNLDRNEERFLTRLRNGLNEEDSILMDISTAGPNWSEDVERAMKPSKYPEAYKKFLSMAIVRRYGEALPEVLRSFDDRFICENWDTSDIPNSKVFAVIDKKNKCEVFKFTRYDLDSLKKWVTDKLQMEVLFSTNIERDTIADFGILLLKKSNQ